MRLQNLYVWGAILYTTTAHNSIHWTNCSSTAPNLECGRLNVPIDWNHPQGEQTSLGLVRWWLLPHVSNVDLLPRQHDRTHLPPLLSLASASSTFSILLHVVAPGIPRFHLLDCTSNCLSYHLRRSYPLAPAILELNEQLSIIDHGTSRVFRRETMQEAWMQAAGQPDNKPFVDDLCCWWLSGSGSGSALWLAEPILATSSSGA